MPPTGGRFGKMFDLGPARYDAADLERLANAMIVRADAADRESTLPAGYTYFGQFIGHDITFDATSSLRQDRDPATLADFRTPRFDLDCVYGTGPVDQPFLYDDGEVKLLLGELLDNGRDFDVPRVAPTERAIIADPRNDENVIIAQLHSAFIRFHNRLAGEDGGASFRAIQEKVRWHYQWIVLHDFLRNIVNKVTYDDVLPHVNANSNPGVHPPRLRFYDWSEGTYLPVEFSAAAYRFGHSTIRPSYLLNDIPGGGGPFDILGQRPASDLRGFRRFNRLWSVDWSLFFGGPRRVQRAHKIDAALAEPLARLPFAGMQDMPSLPLRNLTRGMRLRLPSGQAVCEEMHIEAISDEQLLVGGSTMRLTDISPNFRGKAPLWYYILAEAQQLGGNQLGPVGGRIVMETVVGLMLADDESFIVKDPSWRPRARSIAELIQIAAS